MRLQERDAALERLHQALMPRLSSDKSNVVFSYSQRGSGKTQFIKYFLATKRSEAIKCGRVIVRDCAKETNKAWLMWTKENQRTA